MYVLMLDTHIPIFNNSSSEMCVNQRSFLYWVKFYYHNLYSLEDKKKPPENIVDYDILFDDWLGKREYAEKQKGKKATDMQEVYHIG